MKRISLYLAVMGVMVLASCNKQTGSEYPSHDGEICFSSKGLTITKAVTESTAAVLEANGFKAAVVHDEDNGVMFNKKLTCNNGVYSVAGETYYFPLCGTVSAYAAYPESEVITIQNGVATLGYEQDCTKDLIVAKSTGIGNQKEAISLSFAHVLSQVSFKAKGSDADADYKLKLIEVTAPDGGTYRYGSNDWGDLGEATAYNAFTSAGAAVSTSDYQAFGESMTFIPGKVTLRVVWDCYSKVDGKLVAGYDQSVSTTLLQGELSTIRMMLPNNATEKIVSAIDVSTWNENDMDINLEVRQIPDGFVDLGLPSGLLWAKCNIGAENEEDRGLYFKFGDIAGHTSSSSDLSYFDGTAPEVEVDSDNNLLPAYDAATAAYGEGYRMPTVAELRELRDNTDNVITTINGRQGRKFTSRTDPDQYIFFPNAGECSAGAINNSSITCNLLSSTRHSDNEVYTLYMSSGVFQIHDYNRPSHGYSVRAVHE